MIDSKDVRGRKLGDSHQELTDESEVGFQGVVVDKFRSRKLPGTLLPTVYSFVVADFVCLVYPLCVPGPRKPCIDANCTHVLC